MVERHYIVEIFRERLKTVIDQTGLSRAAFARKIDVDRSTLSQILSGATDRLPRVETLEAIARSEQVSLDWLVGLSQEGGLQSNILPHTLEIHAGGRQMSDALLAQWYGEAAGYKVRYVPSTIPDLLKTSAVFEHEFRCSASTTPSHRQEMGQTLLDYQKRPETDMEVCSSRQSVESIARGWGIWEDLAIDDRRKQLERMIQTTEQLYPTFRWFLFDGLAHFSVPVTIFGPLRAAIYLGQAYLVLNSRDHIQQLIGRFDDLIRAAVVQPHEVSSFLESLLSSIPS